MEEVKPGVSKNPVIFPVMIVDSVLEDVPTGIPESTVIGRKVAQIVKPPKEVHFFESSVVFDPAKGQDICDISPGEFMQHDLGLLLGQHQIRSPNGVTTPS